MADSSFKNNKNFGNWFTTTHTYERITNTSSSNNPTGSNLPYTATPLAKPRRIPPSPYIHARVNNEIKCESDHTFPNQRHPASPNVPASTNIQKRQRNPSTQVYSGYQRISGTTSNEISYTPRRTLPSLQLLPSLSPTFARRRATI